MDGFFSAKTCRCGKSLDGGRIMCWFTEAVLCMDCSAKQSKFKSEM